MILDCTIASYLDDEWRTAPSIHRIIGHHGRPEQTVNALRRLAMEGKAQMMQRGVLISTLQRELKIELFRKWQ